MRHWASQALGEVHQLNPTHAHPTPDLHEHLLTALQVARLSTGSLCGCMKEQIA